MENRRLRLLRTGKSRPAKCRCGRGRGGMCKQHFRPGNRAARHAWTAWERANRRAAAIEDLAPRRVRAWR